MKDEGCQRQTLNPVLRWEREREKKKKKRAAKVTLSRTNPKCMDRDMRETGSR